MEQTAMAPKTTEQLQADAQAAQAQANAVSAREAEEKKAAEERRSSGLWDFIKGLIPDFSFFNILFFAALAFGAYILGKSEAGVGLLEKGIALLPEGWQLGASGLFNKIGIKTDIGGPLLKLAEKDIIALRETLKSNGLEPPLIDTIAANKESFKRFLKPIMDAHGGRATLEDLNPASIVAGPALATYLKPENRASTVAIIRAAMPANAGISEKTLNALIAHGVDEKGNPTGQFNTLIAAVTDGRLEKLQNQLVDAKGQLAPVKLVDVLLNPKNRAFIRSIGTDTIAIALSEKSPTINQKTLDAALKFGDAIDAANMGQNRPRALEVLRAVASIGQGVDAKTAFKNITADELSGFFAVPANQTAVSKLLNVVQPDLARYWGNANQGLVEVLASKPDADKILRYMRGDVTWIEQKLGSLANNAADAVGASLESKLYWAGGNKISENAPVLATILPLFTPPAKPAAAKR